MVYDTQGLEMRKRQVAPTSPTVAPAPAAKGRPRSAEVHQAILDAALELAFDIGFRALSMDAVAATAGVGKMAIYRRWPNKAALVIDAFLQKVGPHASFPEAPSAVESIRLQMRLQAKAFRGRYGPLIKSLLGEAQFDEQLATAFREQWILPRREMARAAIQRAIDEGDVRADADIDAVIDLLYAPIYYRLQIGTGPLTDEYADTILQHALQGLLKTRR